MAHIIVNDTPPTPESTARYEAQVESIRRLASPNAASPLTADQLPETFITDPAYLDAAERSVLRNLKLNTVPSTTEDNYAQVVYLVQLRVAIDLIPQLRSILRQTMVGETVQIESFALEDRLNYLEEKYLEETDDIIPDASTGKIKVTIQATDKRPWPPNTRISPFGSWG